MADDADVKTQDQLPVKVGARWLAQAGGEVNVLDFQPSLLALQEQPPSPLPRAVLVVLLLMLCGLLLWAAFGQLDIVAQAHGKLVPRSYVKIVQPTEQGLLQDILVSEGDVVEAGEVLMRMDATLTQADHRALMADFQYTQLSLRRIDAELSGEPFMMQAGDAAPAFADVNAQYLSNQLAYAGAVSIEQMALDRARSELLEAQGTGVKYSSLLHFYRQQENALAELAREGFATKIESLEKMRDRVSVEQDMQIQRSTVTSAQASVAHSQQRLAQIALDTRQRLNAERVDVASRLARLREELSKLDARQAHFELRAPQRGIVKDVATHTPGTVVSPGTILMTLVPLDDELRAEVWVSNEDVAFVTPGQSVKLKLAPFQFQKYGMVEGEVALVSADAAEQGEDTSAANQAPGMAGLAYRTLVDLSQPYLGAGGRPLDLFSGMRVTAEINLGRRSVLEYVLSPVRKVVHDAGRER